MERFCHDVISELGDITFKNWNDNVFKKDYYILSPFSVHLIQRRASDYNFIIIIVFIVCIQLICTLNVENGFDRYMDKSLRVLPPGLQHDFVQPLLNDCASVYANTTGTAA